jgi:hypothetical protein
MSDNEEIREAYEELLKMFINIGKALGKEKPSDIALKKTEILHKIIDDLKCDMIMEV